MLISAVPPLMLKTEKNPTGAPMSVFDGLREALAANRPQFYRDITLPFYGYNRPGAKISEGIREHWWLQGMLGGMKAHYDCIKAFSETDFTEDLKKIDIPVLVMHGDDDQIVPIVAAGPLSAKILKNATLKVYPGFPHGMPTTNADQINADLLAFLQGCGDRCVVLVTSFAKGCAASLWRGSRASLAVSSFHENKTSNEKAVGAPHRSRQGAGGGARQSAYPLRPIQRAGCGTRDP